MFTWTFARQRTTTLTRTLTDADGDDIAIGDGDIVLFKAGRGNNATPIMDLSSTSTTDNGSGVTCTEGSAIVEVTLDQEDTAELLPAVYDAEICLVNGETGKCRLIEAGVLCVLESLGGNLAE